MLPRKYNFHGHNILIPVFYLLKWKAAVFIIPLTRFCIFFLTAAKSKCKCTTEYSYFELNTLEAKDCWKFDHNINNSVLTQNGSKANILNNRAVFVRAAFTLTVFARSNIISPTYPETISDIYNVESVFFFLSYKSISMDYHSQIIS